MVEKCDFAAVGRAAELLLAFDAGAPQSGWNVQERRIKPESQKRMEFIE
jgi:hypothetical protein